MKITAALSNGADTPFEIAEVELDEPRADEVLVALTAAGVCHTDLTMRRCWPAGDVADRARARGRRRRRGRRGRA